MLREEPAASAWPLTKLSADELVELEAELKCVTDNIVRMIGELSH